MLEKKIITQIIIFVNRKEEAAQCLDRLKKRDMKIGCDFISSEIKSNKEKIEKVNKFRHGEFEIMFATDIMARGIDIRTVGLVVNYGVPLYKKEGAINFHTYIHRIARTGRFIDLGVSLTFLKQK